MMLYKLVSGMNRQRFENVVVSMGNKGTLGPRLQDVGIPIYSLGLTKKFPNPFSVWKFIKIIRKESPAVLQTWLYHADLFGLIAGKLAGSESIIWNLRCSNMDMGHYSFMSAIIVKLLAILSTRPDAIIVNSKAGLDFHEKIGYRPRRWICLPNGFDSTIFKPDMVTRQKIRDELGVSDKTTLFGLVGRFDPMKDHTTFFGAAIKHLKEYSYESKFLLVGRDITLDNSAIRNLIPSEFADKFILLGERKDIPAIMAVLDIAVSSSAFGEGFSNTIGEAMACGVPCVVTDVGDSAHIVGDTGIVVPPRDPQALAEAWAALIKIGPEGRAGLGRRARERIVQNFSLPAIVAKYEALYEEVAESVRYSRLH